MENRLDISGFAVSVESLAKKFDSFVAVDNISFNVPKGEIFGFLGPNGAGKSTTIRMLCGIIPPTSGQGFVGGLSIYKDREKIKLITGYMSQKFSLYGDLTARENLEFYGGVYGLPKTERRERIEWALEMSHLKDRQDDLTGALAGGFKQRLALGAAILHKPSILFLDEPTAGVDPLSRRNFWELIYDLSSQGVTVFVTTHYMDEAEHCDRIAFIDKGKLIKLASPAVLKTSNITGRIFEIITPDWLKAIKLLRAKSDQFGMPTIFGVKIHLDFIGNDIIEVEKYLSSQNIKIELTREIAPSLEDIFVSLLSPDQNAGKVA